MSLKIKVMGVRIMLEINNLYKTIDNKIILNDVNFNIKNGSIIGIIGANGAGKSTLLRCLTGIYRPDKGKVLYDGSEVYENVETKKIIGYVADENNFFYTSKIKDIIKYYSILYDGFDYSKFNKINGIFNIDVSKRVFQLSKGLKMRLSIMLALSINPKYLIMDEPTSGLDPIFKKKLMNMIMKEVADSGTTVVISSHNLNEIERICDSIAFIDKGKISRIDTLENMKRKYRKLQIVFRDEILANCLQYKDIVKINKIGRVYEIVTDNYGQDIVDKLNSLNPMFIEEIDLSLEDIFVYTMEEGGNVYEEILE